MTQDTNTASFLCDKLDLDVPNTFTAHSTFEVSVNDKLKFYSRLEKLIHKLSERQQKIVLSNVGIGHRIDVIPLHEYLELVDAVKRFPNYIKSWVLGGSKVEISDVDELKNHDELQMSLHTEREYFLRDKFSELIQHYNFNHNSFKANKETSKQAPFLCWYVLMADTIKGGVPTKDRYLVIRFRDDRESFFLSQEAVYTILKCFEEKILFGSPDIPKSRKRFRVYPENKVYHSDNSYTHTTNISVEVEEIILLSCKK